VGVAVPSGPSGPSVGVAKGDPVGVGVGSSYRSSTSTLQRLT
jgi:hypothetical protein